MSGGLPTQFGFAMFEPFLQRSTGEIVQRDDADGATAPEILGQKDRGSRNIWRAAPLCPPKGSRRHRGEQAKLSGA